MIERYLHRNNGILLFNILKLFNTNKMSYEIIAHSKYFVFVFIPFTDHAYGTHKKTRPITGQDLRCLNIIENIY